MIPVVNIKLSKKHWHTECLYSRIIPDVFSIFFQDQRKFRSELLALEEELFEKEERFRTAVATRQEFAGQLVAAQQRELALVAENAELTETQVNIFVAGLFST